MTARAYNKENTTAGGSNPMPPFPHFIDPLAKHLAKYTTGQDFFPFVF